MLASDTFMKNHRQKKISFDFFWQNSSSPDVSALPTKQNNSRVQ